MLYRNQSSKTVLVVTPDVDALFLMTAILQQQYRVLSAPDAETALSLLTVSHINLAVIDRNMTDPGQSGLIQRMTAIVPRLRMVFMGSVVENGVIKLQAVNTGNERHSDSLLQCISTALGSHSSATPVKKSRHSMRRPEPGRQIGLVHLEKVMIAGHDIG